MGKSRRCRCASLASGTRHASWLVMSTEQCLSCIQTATGGWLWLSNTAPVSMHCCRCHLGNHRNISYMVPACSLDFFKGLVRRKAQ